MDLEFPTWNFPHSLFNIGHSVFDIKLIIRFARLLPGDAYPQASSLRFKYMWLF